MYKNNDVEVMNMMHTEGRAFAASDIPCFAASDPSFDYDNGGFSAMNDVFYYSQKTHDIWMELLERPPLGYSWKPIKIKGLLLTRPTERENGGCLFPTSRILQDFFENSPITLQEFIKNS